MAKDSKNKHAYRNEWEKMEGGKNGWQKQIRGPINGKNKITSMIYVEIEMSGKNGR
uniref:Uncharacterized protein n=1 Tax=Arundo donax TaxID=35708 RepID=A0A0A9H268_ARUDO